MSFELRHLRQLVPSMSVPLLHDESGYTGRECPEAGCEGYFLVRLGTGLTGPNLPCYCPYCGHQGPPKNFVTKEQLEYVKSVALRQITDAIRRDLKALEFNHPPQGPFGIGISMTLQPGAPIPIRYYREKALETFVTCSICTLEYGVYGVFGYCPDCGTHNSLQILERNLDLTRRQIELAQTLADPALQRHVLEDALENCVSALDGFGREAIRVRAAKSNDPAKAMAISFQNLAKASAQVQHVFGMALAVAVDREVWDTAYRGFMKRHVIAHRSGVVDHTYLEQTGDATAVVGRKVPLSPTEVTGVADAVLRIGRTLLDLLPSLDR